MGEKVLLILRPDHLIQLTWSLLLGHNREHLAVHCLQVVQSEVHFSGRPALQAYEEPVFTRRKAYVVSILIHLVTVKAEEHHQFPIILYSC